MAHVIVPPGWRIPERDVTPEAVYWNRRAFVRTLGAGIAAVGLSGCGSRGAGAQVPGPEPDGPLDTIPDTPTADLYPARRNPGFRPDRPMTEREVAATHNNFYEFLTNKGTVWTHTGPFEARPWTVEIAGEAENTGVHDVADLEREIGLEERVYRFRCVEAWAMVVPWTGFPLARLVEKAAPLSSARYMRFVSFDRPEQAVGQRRQDWYPWPYYEGLRLDEAMNELAMVVTGIYGAPLPKQHGAPIRIITPWKYGFKSAKSVVRIEFVGEEPPTFWNDIAPDEYRFYSNVNPDVPHPRWSQAREEMIGTGERRPTELFNGYGEWVGDLYDPELLTRLS